MKHHAERQVARLFSRQRGLITRAQASDAGLSTQQIQRRLTSGEWIRLASGVYRVASAAPDPLRLLLAAELSTGGSASHRSSLNLAALYRLPPRPELIIPRSATAPSFATGYRSRLEFPTLRVDGIRTLDVEGAILTGAEVLAERELRDVVSAAVTRRLIRPEPFLASIAGISGRVGTGRLRRALEAYVDVAAVESELEARVQRILHRSDLPRGVCQYPVRISGAIYRLDHAWPDQKVAVEIDGFEFHSSRDAFERDRVRRNRLEVAGWLVLNVTHRSVERDGRELLRTIRAALTMRQGA